MADPLTYGLADLAGLPRGVLVGAGASRTDLEQLQAPFAPEDLEWRVQSVGEKNGRPWCRVLVYVTNRAIMERLDAIVGPENCRTLPRGTGRRRAVRLAVRVGLGALSDEPGARCSASGS
jgi:hypothetical protein